MNVRLVGVTILAAVLTLSSPDRSKAAPPATRPAAGPATAPATAPAAKAALPPLLTAAEAKNVEAVVASLLAAGFPDAKGATVYAGKVAVSATFDPAKEPHPLPSAASNTQMTDPKSSKVTYGYEFEGLHFKLADGSWVIATSHHFKPKAGDTVGTADAKTINLPTLTADAIADHPFDAAADGAKWLARVAPAQRERATASMERFVPVTHYLQLGSDDLAPAVVLLHRAGWPDAAALSLAIADQRARSYWQMRPWTNAAPPPFDPTGAYPTLKAEDEAWRAATAAFTSEPPATALRRALFRWCRAELAAESPEDALLPAAPAAAGAKAMVDPKDPQGNAAQVDALTAGMKLPVTVPEDADLVARLQSWEARPRRPRMTVTGGGGGAGGAGASISTSFDAPAPAYTPDKKDLDALVGLLADERPSRFADFAGPHPLGDNAFRALAVLLKADPRALARHPTDHPWTAAERKDAAAAVQTWWKAHHGEYEAK